MRNHHYQPQLHRFEAEYKKGTTAIYWLIAITFALLVCITFWLFI